MIALEVDDGEVNDFRDQGANEVGLTEVEEDFGLCVNEVFLQEGELILIWVRELEAVLEAGGKFFEQFIGHGEWGILSDGPARRKGAGPCGVRGGMGRRSGGYDQSLVRFTVRTARPWG